MLDNKWNLAGKYGTGRENWEEELGEGAGKISWEKGKERELGGGAGREAGKES